MRGFSPIYDVLAVIDFIDAARNKLRDLGIEFETSNDFEAYEAACAALSGKAVASEPFNSKFYDVLPDDGMWFCGRRGGDIVKVHAMRRESLTGVCLADYWNLQLPRIHGGKVGERHCPGARQIGGLVVYHGDLYVKPELRRNNIASLSSQLSLALALIKWAPDYFYCFVSPRACRRGFHINYGYSHAQPRAVDWIECPEGIRPDDWLCWTSFEDLVHLIMSGGLDDHSIGPPAPEKSARGPTKSA